jgi:large subunit ribosomal protein L6
MSRIGKMPIDVPKGVTVAVAGGVVSVKGPKGELKLPVRPEISVVVDGGKIVVDKKRDGRFPHSMRGTTRALLANMITGVTQGFEKKLDINGVGYEAEVNGKTLVLKLGFNRPVRYEVPATVTVEAPTLTSLVVRGIDNQQVGTVAAAIRKLRKPEPYKGKGIKYSTETIKRKAGKAFASGGGG